MISFSTQHDFEWSALEEEKACRWLQDCISEEGKEEGDLNYVFCSDEYLHAINLKFLDHDTLTDIITFDYTHGDVLSGEIYISTDRVAENAEAFKASFAEELHRVMIHGVLHLIGYTDSTKEERKRMRLKEDHYLGRR
ncbi:rRNA maturation RNase YbeY [Croceiramulus getboli]|nr:rRNA maturation RNase YbeY [Flavobacteriaceae bacterium YJPT1-3]